MIPILEHKSKNYSIISGNVLMST